MTNKDMNKREALEQAAKAICPHCARGRFAEYQGDPTPAYWHGHHECKATPVRLLLRAVLHPAPDAAGSDNEGAK